MEYIALVVLIIIVIFVERFFWNRAIRKAKEEFPLPDEYQPVDHSEEEENDGDGGQSLAGPGAASRPSAAKDYARARKLFRYRTAR